MVQNMRKKREKTQEIHKICSEVKPLKAQIPLFVQGFGDICYTVEVCMCKPVLSHHTCIVIIGRVCMPKLPTVKSLTHIQHDMFDQQDRKMTMPYCTLDEQKDVRFLVPKTNESFPKVGFDEDFPLKCTTKQSMR